MNRVDMGKEAIETRLEAVARLSDLSFRQQPRVSMAPADVETRLEALAEMSAICLELGRLARKEQ